MSARRPSLAALALLLASGAPAAAGEPAALFPIVQDGRWGFVDSAGKVVIPPRFDRAERFSEGLAAVKLGHTFGYVDRSGKVVLVPRQEPAATLHRPFRNGLALVKGGGRFGFIDRKGEVAIPLRFAGGDDFAEGFAMVCSEAGCGFVDARGRGVIPPGAMASPPVSEGMACLVLSMSMSIARVVLRHVETGPLPGELEGCGPMSEGLVAVRSRDSWGYLDREGRGAIAPRFAEAGPFRGGLAPAREDPRGPCGYVDRTGAFAIAPRFRECHPFSGGLARVDLAAHETDAQRVAFVDRNGAVVIDGSAARPPFDSALDFEDGLAAVGQGGSPSLAGAGGPYLGYVDPAGRYVWRPTR